LAFGKADAGDMIRPRRVVAIAGLLDRVNDRTARLVCASLCGETGAMRESMIHAGDEAATAGVARDIAARAQAGDVILLSGPLGAGKTVFARAFIRARVGDPAVEIPSPTFTLVQTYESPGGDVWHYDLWRVEGEAALEELAWDEARAGIILVEWPERLGGLAPADALRITIGLVPSGREVRISGPGRWFDAS